MSGGSLFLIVTACQWRLAQRRCSTICEGHRHTLSPSHTITMTVKLTIRVAQPEAHHRHHPFPLTGTTNIDHNTLIVLLYFALLFYSTLPSRSERSPSPSESHTNRNRACTFASYLLHRQSDLFTFTPSHLPTPSQQGPASQQFVARQSINQSQLQFNSIRSIRSSHTVLAYHPPTTNHHPPLPH